MPQTVKSDICFRSADGTTTVHGSVFTPPEGTAVVCVLQLAHGMCEYVGRYTEFATYCNEHGIAVCGNDHIGHGGSVSSQEEYGYFGKDGREFVLQDMHTMNTLAHEQFPGVPLVLLGHSMGSFFARAYATRWPATINGLVICGTGGPNPLVGMGITLAGLMGRLRGGHHRSKLVHNIAFGQYLQHIENPKTPYDWISHDEEIVAAYAADERCNFRFTANGFHELFSILKEVSGPEWAQKLPKTLPTLLVAGEEDPVGEYGKGVETVHLWLQNAGLQNLSCKLYPHMRHEILNELGRDEVYKDIAGFVLQCAKLP